MPEGFPGRSDRAVAFSREAWELNLKPCGQQGCRIFWGSAGGNKPTQAPRFLGCNLTRSTVTFKTSEGKNKVALVLTYEMRDFFEYVDASSSGEVRP